MFQMDNLENSITGQYLEDRIVLLPVKHDTNIEIRDFLTFAVLDRKNRSCLFFSCLKVIWPKLEIGIKRLLF